MPKHTFDCGHTGKGKYCHRCAEEENRARLKREKKEKTEDAHRSDVICLRDFPPKVVEKTREVLAELAAGVYWGTLHGKRLNRDRNKISIPITDRYRLILHIEGGKPVPKALETHADYNHTINE